MSSLGEKGAIRQRSVAIDVVRIVGVVGVVAGHLWAGGEGEPNALRVALYSWHVPLFFFLTGYLWTTGRNFRSDTRSRARSLLLPYACWILLLGVPLYGLSTVRSGFPAEDVFLTLYGGGLVRGFFAPYWFLPVLFFVAIALRAFERYPRWVTWVVAVVGLACSYIWGADLSHLPLDVFFTFPCLLFALFGQELRSVESRIPKRGLVGGAALLGSAVLLTTGLARPLDMKLGDFGTPVLSVLVAVAICAGLILLSGSALGEGSYRWGPLVSELAATTVVVLLTHTFIFVALGLAGLPVALVFVGALVISWTLGVVIHRTFLSPWLAGIPRKTPRDLPQHADVSVHAVKSSR